MTDRDGVYDKAAEIGPASPTDPRRLFDAANEAISKLLTAAWPEPYALVLSNELYTDAHSSIGTTTDTPVKRLADRVTRVITSAALTNRQGVLVSLAGEPITVYIARPAAATFTGETSDSNGRVQYRFRVYERLQYVIRDPTAIVKLSLASTPRSGSTPRRRRGSPPSPS